MVINFLNLCVTVKRIIIECRYCHSIGSTETTSPASNSIIQHLDSTQQKLAKVHNTHTSSSQILIYRDAMLWYWIEKRAQFSIRKIIKHPIYIQKLIKPVDGVPRTARIRGGQWANTGEVGRRSALGTRRCGTNSCKQIDQNSKKSNSCQLIQYLKTPIKYICPFKSRKKNYPTDAQEMQFSAPTW